MLNSSGEKFGKSESSPIWIDPTDPAALLELHQFLFNQPDDMISQLLNQYTFLNSSEIEGLLASHLIEPDRRIGQSRLSEIVLLMLTNNSHQVEQIKNYRLYFKLDQNYFKGLDEEEMRTFFDGMWNVIEIKDSLKSRKVLDAIQEFGQTGLTRGEIKKRLKEGQVKVNFRQQKLNSEIEMDHILEGNFLVVQLSKKQFFTWRISDLV